MASRLVIYLRRGMNVYLLFFMGLLILEMSLCTAQKYVFQPKLGKRALKVERHQTKCEIYLLFKQKMHITSDLTTRQMWWMLLVICFRSLLFLATSYLYHCTLLSVSTPS